MGNSSFRDQKLGDLYCLSCGTPNGVMSQHYHSEVEHRARADPSYRDRHAGAALEVKPGLGTVDSLIHFDRWNRGGGQLADPGRAAEAAERLDGLSRISPPSELHRDRCHVAIYHRYPVGVHTKGELRRLDGATGQRSQNFPALALDLFLLTGYE